MPRKRSAPDTSASLAIVFGMGSIGSCSPGKKTLGCRERDPQQRLAHLRLRERYRRRPLDL